MSPKPRRASCRRLEAGPRPPSRGDVERAVPVLRLLLAISLVLVLLGCGRQEGSPPRTTTSSPTSDTQKTTLARICGSAQQGHEQSRADVAVRVVDMPDPAAGGSRLTYV